MSFRKLWLSFSVLTLAVGCGSSAGDAVSPSEVNDRATTAVANENESESAERAIAEADIIQLDAGHLYALSKSGTVSVVDVSKPGALTLLGQTTLQGKPFEMYLREDLLLVMANDVPRSEAKAGTGDLIDVPVSAAVIVLDVRDPARVRVLATSPVTGQLADSRVVGDVLYLATYENSSCYQCASGARTLVTSFDISEPEMPRRVEQVAFESDAPAGSNFAWTTHWKRSVFMTDQRLYVAGQADFQSVGSAKEGIIDVIDVSDPEGRLRTGPRIEIAGPILSRWQLDEHAGVLRVVSQRGAGSTSNGLSEPEIETFRIEDEQFTPLGHTRMSLPRPEGLRAVRFDGPRAYAITYQQTDPLFVIDLSDPAHPEQRGELHMPGFMFHLEPHGDRVIGLGVDRTDPEGSLNVSLFDVSDADEPTMLKRVAFATPRIGEDYQILNSAVPEDQDRIQKSFRVFESGLVVVPFTALRPYSSFAANCENAGGGVQLVEWRDDSLQKRALLPLPGNPRRAFEHEQALITVSDSNVRAFSLANSDVAHETADLTIGSCSPPPSVYPSNRGFVRQELPNRADYDDDYPRACSMIAAHGSSAGWPVVLGLLALALPRLGRRARTLK